MKRYFIILLALIACHAATFAQRQKPVCAKVMTFNIRTANKGDGINNWEMRYQKVCAFLLKSKADIVGLQEVKHGQLTDLANALTDYGYVGVGRDDGQQGGEYNPVFFNKNRFNLLRSGTFWLSQTPEEPSLGWDAACRRIATWAILQDKATLKSIIVLNTHLDHVGTQARINGAALIKERLGRMANELPVIITGDMNVDEADPAYTKLTTGIFPTNDAYRLAKCPKGPTYTFHAFGQCPADKRRKIDFILLSQQIKVKAAEIIDSSLGNGTYLSDHNPHTASIVY